MVTLLAHAKKVFEMRLAPAVALRNFFFEIEIGGQMPQRANYLHNLYLFPKLKIGDVLPVKGEVEHWSMFEMGEKRTGVRKISTGAKPQTVGGK